MELMSAKATTIGKERTEGKISEMTETLVQVKVRKLTTSSVTSGETSVEGILTGSIEERSLSRQPLAKTYDVSDEMVEIMKSSLRVPTGMSKLFYIIFVAVDLFEELSLLWESVLPFSGLSNEQREGLFCILDSLSRELNFLEVLKVDSDDEKDNYKVDNLLWPKLKEKVLKMSKLYSLLQEQYEDLISKLKLSKVLSLSLSRFMLFSRMYSLLEST